jgi:flagellar protein FliT
MNDEAILSVYQRIAELTEQMLAAARGSDWDTLLHLEHECRALFAQLSDGEDERVRDANFQRRKANLIRGVLDDDAQIRLLVEPWLAHLSELIGHTGRQRRLSDTYRAGE